MNSAMAEHTRIERNKITPQVREVVRVRDGNECQICQEPIVNEPWEIDHIIPLRNGGMSTLDNLQLTHRTCNRMKGAGPNMRFRKGSLREMEEWYERINIKLEADYLV